MKTLAAAAAAAVAVALGAFATDYYVNPDPAKASDGYDGTAAVWAGGESTVGPKLTLQGAMGIALKENDVVHAAEGLYNEGGVWDGGSNRVLITVAGVALVADGCRDRTIIEGVVSTLPDNVSGCGSNAVRCVKITGAGSYVRGFTLRNGATQSVGSYDERRAGIQYGGRAVDCVLTGGRAAFRSGGCYNVTCIGCHLYDNLSPDGFGHNGLNCYNCLLEDYIYGSSTLVNCTCVGAGGLRGTTSDQPYNATCYNSFFENPLSQTIYRNCRSRAAFKSDSTFGKDSFVISETEANLDPVTHAPLRGSLLIDAGSNDLYETSFPVAFKETFGGLDFMKAPRITGRQIDIGAVEYDWKDEVGGVLDAKGFLTVTALSNAVYTAEGTSAVMPVGTGMDAVWACPSGDVQEETYAFTAVATGSAVLTVWRNGSATPAWTLAADGGGQTFSYKAKAHSLRFEVSGADGNVTLSSFVTTAHRCFFVDAQKGNDDNDGTTLAKARETLAGAMAIPGLTAGDVVYAAPGVYSNGVMTVSSERYRVALKDGIELVGLGGPSQTAIEGEGPCGPDAIRCVYVDATSAVRGFTIRKGYTPTTKNAYGGGVLFQGQGAVVDCVITNNTSNYRGGGVAGEGGYVRGSCIRCYFADNVALGGAGPGVNQSSCFGCYAKGGGGSVFTDGKLVNCTLDDAGVAGKSHANAFNCLFTYRDTGKMDLYRCLLGVAHYSGTVVHDGTRESLGNTLVMRAMYEADTLRPKAGSLPLDFGDTNHYLTNFPSAWTKYRDTDYAGGQRIYNGRIDCGAGEFDWRGDFSQRLGRGVELSQMSADVTTNAVGKVALTDGCRLVATWTVAKEGQASVAAVVEGDGTLTVKMDGETLSDQEGRYAKYVQPGEHVCEISFAGAGRAVIDSFRNMTGMVLIFR